MQYRASPLGCQTDSRRETCVNDLWACLIKYSASKPIRGGPRFQNHVVVLLPIPSIAAQAVVLRGHFYYSLPPCGMSAASNASRPDRGPVGQPRGRLRGAPQRSPRVQCRSCQSPREEPQPSSTLTRSVMYTGSSRSERGCHKRRRRPPTSSRFRPPRCQSVTTRSTRGSGRSRRRPNLVPLRGRSAVLTLNRNALFNARHAYAPPDLLFVGEVLSVTV